MHDPKSTLCWIDWVKQPGIASEPHGLHWQSLQDGFPSSPPGRLQTGRNDVFSVGIQRDSAESGAVWNLDLGTEGTPSRSGPSKGQGVT